MNEKQLPPDAVKIVLPSGATGRFRPMRVSDEDILTNKQSVRDGQVINKLLEACWLGFDDPGIYAAEIESGKFDLVKLLQCDRFCYLIHLRANSFSDGNDYQFSIPCPACDRVSKSSVDLLRDIPVKPLPPESVAILAGGTNRFQYMLPQSKRIVTFHLPTGVDETKMARHAKQVLSGHASSIALRMRIEEVSGVDEAHLRNWIEGEMTSADADALRDEMDRVDGGLITTVEVICENCGAVFEADLPFGTTFFLPRRGQMERDRTVRLRS